jgi:precorrin-6B methylase 2
MNGIFFLRQFSALAACALLASGVAAQAADKPFEPYSGQPGKDVVWVPTAQPMVDKMLDLAGVKAGDVHFDLGSGDGRTVITATKRGAKSTGIEYNPDMVELSKKNAAKEGVPNAVFMKADLFETDFSNASVLTLFLLPDINLRLRPKILDMKPGTRVVSNTFTMGEWKSDEIATVDEGSGCSYYCTALLWIVPAKVAGTWQLGQSELALTQEFQVVGGTLKNGDKLSPVSGRLRGDAITFSAGGAEYSGRVNGNTITGTLKGGAAFTATRGGKPAK